MGCNTQCLFVSTEHDGQHAEAVAAHGQKQTWSPRRGSTLDMGGRGAPPKTQTRRAPAPPRPRAPKRPTAVREMLQLHRQGEGLLPFCSDLKRFTYFILGAPLGKTETTSLPTQNGSQKTHKRSGQQVLTVHNSDEQRDWRAKDDAMTAAEASQGASIHNAPQTNVQ